MQTPQAIQWPEITVGGRKFTLRYSFTAGYQLQQWGKTLANATYLELAAAMAGHFEPDGTWQTEGFAKAVHFADLMTQEESAFIVDPVTEALKKAYPEATIKTLTVPGKTDEATKTEPSTSGPLPLPAVV